MALKRWQDWVNVILGAWMVASPWILGFAAGESLVASPWALGFADHGTPTTNAVIVGLLVTAFGVWSMLLDTSVQKWWHEH